MFNYIKAITDSDNFDDAIREASNIVWNDDDLWESPIERTLGTALFSVGWLYAPTFIFKSPCELSDLQKAHKRFQQEMPKEFGNVVIITTQHKMGKYRADFALTAKVGKTIKAFIVEADGHEFHEKTKYQAIRDKKRDRFFVSKGLTTLRFSGSEIMSGKHFDLADEVYQIVGFK